MLSKIGAFLLITMCVISLSCNHDQDDNPVFIKGKSLVKIIYRQYIYLYVDKPVTRIVVNSHSFSNDLLISDTITVTNFEYVPDSHFISKLLHQYKYNANGNLEQERVTGLVNQNERSSSIQYFYDNQNQLIKVLYDENAGYDSILVQYNLDNTFFTTEYVKGYKSIKQYSKDSTGKIFKLDQISFFNTQVTGSQEITYSGNNAILATFYSDSIDSTSKFDTNYTYLDNRFVPEILKNKIDPFIGNFSPILILNQFENIAPSYKHNFLDYSLDANGKTTYEYNFSSDGFPIWQKTYGTDSRIIKEIEYYYE